MVIQVNKMIKLEDKSANIYLNHPVYGISGYQLGILEEVRVSPSTGEQEFWVRNSYGLIQFSYFCIVV